MDKYGYDDDGKHVGISGKTLETVGMTFHSQRYRQYHHQLSAAAFMCHIWIELGAAIQFQKPYFKL
jgi:hypothetical protein